MEGSASAAPLVACWWALGIRFYLGVFAVVLAGVFESLFVAGDFASVFVLVFEVVVAGALSVAFVVELPPLGLDGVHAVRGSALLVVTATLNAKARRTDGVRRICIVLPWLDISFTDEGIG